MLLAMTMSNENLAEQHMVRRAEGEYHTHVSMDLAKEPCMTCSIACNYIFSATIMAYTPYSYILAM